MTRQALLTSLCLALLAAVSLALWLYPTVFVPHMLVLISAVLCAAPLAMLLHVRGARLSLRVVCAIAALTAPLGAWMLYDLAKRVLLRWDRFEQAASPVALAIGADGVSALCYGGMLVYSVIGVCAWGFFVHKGWRAAGGVSPAA